MIKTQHLLLILFVIFILFCECEKDNNTHEWLTSEHFVIASDSDGFDLRNSQTMTFFKNKFAKGRRTSQIPQLTCVGGNACNVSHTIQSIQCENNGTNENDDVQWKCSANLPSNLSLTNTNVNCEGLKNNSDKIKLKGSCGLEYNLDSSIEYNNSYNSYTSIIIVIIMLLFVTTICFSIYAHPIGYRSYGYYGYPEYYTPPYFGRRYNDYGSSYDYSRSYDYGRRSDYGSTSNTGFGSTKTR